MNIARILKHLCYPGWMVRRAFSSVCQDAIARAIQIGEQAHAGEIRFAVEGGLDGLPLFKGQTPRARAIEVFSQLRVWDTAHNNGVLIYVLLADHAVEIVADRGIHERVGAYTWDAICHQMEVAFSRADFQSGAVGGIEALNHSLCEHFPKHVERANELPDAPVILG
jgi:TPM domain